MNAYYAQFGSHPEVSMRGRWMVSGPQSDATMDSNVPGLREIFEGDDHVQQVIILRGESMEDHTGIQVWSRRS